MGVLSRTAEYLGMDYFLVGAILSNSLLVLPVFSLATPRSRLLKETGSALLTRILRLIWKAVGVQFVISRVGKIWR